MEHLVNSLSNHNLIYDVMTKKPSTVEAALDLIQWHENCHSIQRKKTGIRQLKTEQDSEDGLIVHKVNGKSFVTEERLNQFGRELKDGIMKDIKELVGRATTHKMYGETTQTKRHNGVLPLPRHRATLRGMS